MVHGAGDGGAGIVRHGDGDRARRAGRGQGLDDERGASRGGDPDDDVPRGELQAREARPSGRHVVLGFFERPADRLLAAGHHGHDGAVGHAERRATLHGVERGDPSGRAGADVHQAPATAEALGDRRRGGGEVDPGRIQYRGDARLRGELLPDDVLDGPGVEVLQARPHLLGGQQVQHGGVVHETPPIRYRPEARLLLRRHPAERVTPGGGMRSAILMASSNTAGSGFACRGSSGHASTTAVAHVAHRSTIA